MLINEERCLIAPLFLQGSVTGRLLDVFAEKSSRIWDSGEESLAAIHRQDFKHLRRRKYSLLKMSNLLGTHNVVTHHNIMLQYKIELKNVQI